VTTFHLGSKKLCFSLGLESSSFWLQIHGKDVQNRSKS